MSADGAEGAAPPPYTDYLPTNEINAPMSAPMDWRLQHQKGEYTDSGFVTELDESIGQERHKFTHPSGSALEYRPDGSVVFTSTSDDIRIIMKDGILSVLGDYKISVSGDLDIDCTNYYVKARGTYKVEADGEATIVYSGPATTNSKVSTTLTTPKYDISAAERYNLKAPSIDIGGTGGDSRVQVHAKTTKITAQAELVLGNPDTMSCNLSAKTIVSKSLKLDVDTKMSVETVYVSKQVSVTGLHRVETTGPYLKTVTGSEVTQITGGRTLTIAGVDAITSASSTLNSSSYNITSNVNIIGTTNMQGTITVSGVATLNGPLFNMTPTTIAGGVLLKMHIHGNGNNGSPTTPPLG